MNRKAILLAVVSAIVLVSGLFSLLGAAPASAAPAAVSQMQDVPFPDQRSAVQNGVAWLVDTHQNEDGGYTSFSTGANQGASDVGGTVDALLAIASAGYNAAFPAPGHQNATLDYMRLAVADMMAYGSGDAGQASKLVLALAAAGQNPRDFAGIDFVAILNSHLDNFDAASPFSQALVILALDSVYEPIPESVVQTLAAGQAAGDELDGSWGDGFGTLGNIDATAMSVMALHAAALTTTNESLDRAVAFLDRTRLESGGWEYAPGFGENVNSTAMALQAYSALGLDFYTPDEAGSSPLNALLSWQGESGAFQADFGDGRFDDFFSTVQALPAASGRSLPLPARYVAASRAVDCLVTLQDPAGGGWEQFATFGVSAAGTSRAIQAIVAVGDDPTSARWQPNGSNAVEALEALTPAFLETSAGGGVGIVMQGVVAAGGDVNDFAGTDLVLAMSQHLSPTGEYDSTAFGPFSHSEAMLGLIVAGAEVDPSAVDFLLSAQADGDFGGADSTGLALNVLSRLDYMGPDAVSVLHVTQEADGGWGFGEANPNSSSEAVQGLVSAGENPFGPAWSQVVSGTLTNAADAVLAQQGANGCWPNLFGPGDDPFATTDAVLLLTAQPVWAQPHELAPVPVLISEEPVEVEPEPEATAEAETAAAPTAAPEPTPELIAEATEVTEAAPTAAPVVEAAPEQPAEAPAAAEEGGLPTLWLVVGLVLLAAAAAYFYMRR